MPAKSCAGTLRELDKLQLYLAFGRSTTPIHGKGYATPKSCNFTSRSVARPPQSMVRVARGHEKLQLYLACGRWTTPIHGKGCAGRRKIATFPRLAQPLPWIGVVERKLRLFQLFGVTGNPYHGLAWSSVQTRGKVATIIRLWQPLPWIGVVERANAR